MISPSRRPFQNLSGQQWQNLAIAGVVVFFAAQVLLDIAWRNFCGRLAIDYCAFWSAGRIARSDGYAAVYDLSRMEAIQRQVFPSELETLADFPVVPTPYLPVFLVPFALLVPLGPQLGYVVWTVINALILCCYLNFFATSASTSQPRRRLLILMLVAFPVFLNFLYGQVNIWLTIFVGEYMRAAAAGKPYRAGMWLAGLLIKPQFLVLIGIALLMQRSARTLAGLATMSIPLLGISYAMLGGAGFTGLLQLWLGFAGGIPATGPNVMMNWRTVGLFLETLFSPMVVWTLIAAAMVTTAVAGLAPWRKPIAPASPSFPVAVLGTLAATCAFVWHSHIYSATILICPLMLLYQAPPRLPKNTLELWVLIPPAFHLIAISLAGLLKTGILTGISPDFIFFLSAVAPFGFNIFLLTWAVRYLRQVDAQGPGLVPS